VYPTPITASTAIGVDRGTNRQPFWRARVPCISFAKTWPEAAGFPGLLEQVECALDEACGLGATGQRSESISASGDQLAQLVKVFALLDFARNGLDRRALGIA